MKSPTEHERLAVRQHPSDLTMVMEQQWRHLLFLHWEYDAGEIQKTLPPGLFVDTFDGKAYVGIVPFWIPEVKVKLVPFIPGLSDLFELNLRTYVYDESGTPGVWFYSLDTNNFLIVQAAKAFFHLPYRYSQIQSIAIDGQVEFSCKPQGVDAILNYRYQVDGSFAAAKPNSLEFFLTERYVAFVLKAEGLASGRIHHSPYLLGTPQVSQWDVRLFEINRLIKPQRPPDHVLYSPGVDVKVFALQDIYTPSS